MPSLISVHVTDGPDYKLMSRAASTIANVAADMAPGRYRWTEYNGKISDFSVTVNEKIAVLSDKT